MKKVIKAFLIIALLYFIHFIHALPLHVTLILSFLIIIIPFGKFFIKMFLIPTLLYLAFEIDLISIYTTLIFAFLILISYIFFHIAKKKNKTAYADETPPRYTTKEGYRQHYNPSSPDARRNGYAPVHRDSARAKYKRDIGPNEVVHHRNGNKRDNRWRNLEIVTRSEHAKIHNFKKYKRK